MGGLAPFISSVTVYGGAKQSLRYDGINLNNTQAGNARACVRTAPYGLARRSGNT